MGFLERRRQTKEIKREMEFRRGSSRIKSYVKKSEQKKKEYWQLGKKALQLGDRQQFEHIARAYQWTLEQINRWERYLVQLETIKARRDQVQATGDFMKSMSAMSKSMLAGVAPEELSKMQVNLEQAIIKAETLDETLAMVMDASSETIFSADEFSEETLGEVEKAMAGEAEAEEADTFDTKIDAGLKKIEEEMRKDMK